MKSIVLKLETNEGTFIELNMEEARELFQFLKGVFEPYTERTPWINPISPNYPSPPWNPTVTYHTGTPPAQPNPTYTTKWSVVTKD